MKTEAALPPGFGGKLVIEIERWERAQYVGLAHPGMPREYSFQGGLNYFPSFELWGRVTYPESMAAKSARIWMSSVGSEPKPDRRSQRDVGRLYFESPEGRGWDMSLSLLLPASAVAPAATCLASTWNYVQLSISNGAGGQASVSAYGFADVWSPKGEPHQEAKR